MTDEEQAAELTKMQLNMIEYIELFHNNKIFQPRPLKKFLNETLAKINPHMSMSTNAEEYYAQIFTTFLMPKTVFSFWDVMNDRENYEYWPHVAKADVFMENCFKETYEGDVRAKFIYN